MENNKGLIKSVAIVIIILVVAFVVIKMNLNKIPSNGTIEENNSQTNTVNGKKLAAREVLGNKDDLVYFSVEPNTVIGGPMVFIGRVKGGYFFEGNILVSIADKNKIVIKEGHGNATGDWMKSDVVEFNGSIDLTGLPQGEAYIVIHNDNASGIKSNDKEILIPIVIK